MFRSIFQIASQHFEIRLHRKATRSVNVVPTLRDRAADHPIFLLRYFTLSIRKLIVFTTIPSSINLSAIITQILDSSPTRLHFIVPRSIFKRRRLSRRVCFDTVHAHAHTCVRVHTLCLGHVSFLP